jgi:ATP synthase protein I
MNDETIHQHVGRAIHEGWGRSGAFAGSILSGALLGFLADQWLGTGPWLVVVGSIVGSYSAFLNVWRWSKEGAPDNER